MAAEISEARLFEWLGRLYAERCLMVSERDEARVAAVRIAEQLREATEPKAKIQPKKEP